ncbi:MAG: CHAT domain-containing protein [bacterium]|nr:CHAT domain-containing protein [bacterium]
MTDYADLEIGLHCRDAHSYAVELRLRRPEDEADVRGHGLAEFDFQKLRIPALDGGAYGELLSASLFQDSAVSEAFGKARASAQTQELTLRVRLLIGPSAPELHRLRWETLRDPENGSPLFTGEEVLFCRYLSSLDWRRVRLRPETKLNALVLIANPSDVDQYRPGGRTLAPVDVAGELARARTGLGSIPVTALESGGSATLSNLTARLRDGYDVLYLVCHGALIRREPWLWLEDEAGRVARVAGEELVTRLRELHQRPRLVVLASCQSAGTGDEGASSDGGALAALGPRLAEAGIPAVLAMQGSVSMQTVAEFMPVFFLELQQDGQIDRAMAVARGAVRERPDYWMPVLFMRLRSGRIWYVPGFGDDRRGFEKWPALWGTIEDGCCTPILGPGLTESLLGSSRDVARRWAEEHHFPMAPQAREDLAHVAQYLAVAQAPRFPRAELKKYLRNEILERYEGGVPDELRDAPLNLLIEEVGARRRESDPAEPHKVLADLPFETYLTTNPDGLLESALAEAGKDPQTELCRWHSDLEPLPSICDRDPDYRPDSKRPLVYHLFGRLDEPESMVLTEDDYFDYLIGVTENKELIPTVVRRARADSALLFLGFQIDDWNFRVLFRSIMSQQGGRRRRDYAHVAVQIDPEAGRILDPERARRYLESYFQGADVSIYWGSVEDFVNELWERWSQGGAK